MSSFGIKLSERYPTTCRCPFLDALWSGVYPKEFFGCFSSTLPMKYFTILKCPLLAARCSGVSPKWSFGHIFGSNSDSNSTIFKWPTIMGYLNHSTKLAVITVIILNIAFLTGIRIAILEELCDQLTLSRNSCRILMKYCIMTNIQFVCQQKQINTSRTLISWNFGLKKQPIKQPSKINHTS